MADPSNQDWAEAIASRISDEWSVFARDQETRPILEGVLTEALVDRPDLIARLVGTGVIEEDYFQTTEEG